MTCSRPSPAQERGAQVRRALWGVMGRYRTTRADDKHDASVLSQLWGVLLISSTHVALDPLCWRTQKKAFESPDRTLWSQRDSAYEPQQRKPTYCVPLRQHLHTIHKSNYASCQCAKCSSNRICGDSQEELGPTFAGNTSRPQRPLR